MNVTAIPNVFLSARQTVFSRCRHTLMKTPPLSQHLALRIGLAARALPDRPLHQLMEVLVDLLGLPLSEQKFRTLSVQRLRLAQDGVFAVTPRACLREALGFLQGTQPIVIQDDDVLELDAYSEGDLPDSIRVALVANAQEMLDASFSACTSLLIYQVSAREIRLIDRRRVPDPVSTPAVMALASSKAQRENQRITLIDDCHLLYAKSLNNPVTARLMRSGIHPVQVPEGGHARALLAALQSVLGKQPPPWLARAMGRSIVIPSGVGLSGPVLVHSTTP